MSGRVNEKKQKVNELEGSISVYSPPVMTPSTNHKYRGYRLELLSAKSSRSNCSTKSNPKDIILGNRGAVQNERSEQVV